MTHQPVVNAWMQGNRLHLKHRCTDGTSFVKQERFWFSSYHKSQDLTDDAKKYLRDSKYVSALRIEGDWLRAEWDTYQSRKVHNGEALPDGEPNVMFAGNSYEADVMPVRRYMVDNDVPIGQPKRVFLDIETDSRKSFVEACAGMARVLCWALVDEEGVVTSRMLEADDDRAELGLLTGLWVELRQYDQVIAWNGDGFDFPVIIERSKYLGVGKQVVDSFLWLDQMQLFKRMNTAENAEEKTSYRLQDIAVAMLGKGKDDLDGAKTWEYWVAGGATREQLMAYNIKDTQLLQELEQKTGFIQLLQALAGVSGIFPDTKGLHPLSQVDSFLLRLGKKRGVHFKTNFHGNNENVKVRGAYVMQPEAEGVERSIHVADFRRLYPSVILSWNMSPETLKEGDTGCKCPTIESTFDNQRMGILPTALKELIQLREEWTTKKSLFAPGTPEWFDADRLSTAYKVAANSFYGVMASPFSRFFHPLIAESVTQTGVYLILETKRRAEEQGMKVIYADTDSIFVKGVSVEEFKSFVEKCNTEFYPEIAKRFGCIENDIHLAYEKAFDRIVFVSAKKYAGSYLHYKGKKAVAGSKPEVKGLEYKRGDSTKFARTLQEQVITLLLKGEEQPDVFEKVLQGWQNKILQSPLELQDVVVVKSISRELGLYRTKMKKDGTMSNPPRHVQVAAQMKSRGEEVREGTKIRMVVMDATTKPPTVIPAVDCKGECDRHYMWESLVYPPTERLLESAFPKHNWQVFGKTRPVTFKARTKKASPHGLNEILDAPEKVVAIVAKGRRKKAHNADQGNLLGGHSTTLRIDGDVVAVAVTAAPVVWEQGVTIIDEIGAPSIEAITKVLPVAHIPTVTGSFGSYRTNATPREMRVLNERMRAIAGHEPFKTDYGPTYFVKDFVSASEVVKQWRQENNDIEAKRSGTVAND